MQYGGYMPKILDPEAVILARATVKKEKVFTLKRLMALLNCSRGTAQKTLSFWKTYTSFNKNSKYYTLPEIPKFDSHGLWWYNEEIAFSEYGNLKKTVINLVQLSDSGLTGKELASLVSIPARNFVHHYKDCPEITREKQDGVFVHFSSQPETYQQQIQKRTLATLPERKDFLTDSDVITILISIVKHHGITPKEILALPEVSRIKISELTLQNFMESHDLLKKTPDI